MSGRARFRVGAGSLALWLVLSLALPVRAQEEPTPFWGAPPPPATPTRQKRKTPPPKAPPASPPKKKPAPVKATRKPARREAPPPVVKKSRKPERRSVAPPPPALSGPAKPAGPAGPAEPSGGRRTIRPGEPRPARSPEQARPLEPAHPEPAPTEHGRGAPVVLPEGSAQLPPTPREGVQSLTIEPLRPEEPPQRLPGARFSVDLLAGAWGKGRADGGPRSYDPAIGLRLGWALLVDRLEIDLLIARAGGTEGNAFANATATHALGNLRAFWVIGQPQIALLVGVGAGAALAQSHYSLQDTGGTPQTLDATSARPVFSGAGAVRVRWKAFEARAELSALLRDGQLELLPLFGLGVGF